MSTHNLYTHPNHDESSPTHRIGGISRLAGVPVSTLRMWESRHGAFTPGKTGGRHRLYAEGDVVRARLLRQLTDAGHSISGIARLPAWQLQQMLAETDGARLRVDHGAGPRRLALVVVGVALATRIGAPDWQRRLPGEVVDVREVFATLGEAMDAIGVTPAPAGDVLLARVNALRPERAEELLRLRRALGARHSVVLYNFGPDAVVGALRQAGFLVRREPVDDGELAELVRSGTWARDPAPEPAGLAAAALPVRRFSEQELARVAASPPKLLCECPRHLAEIITQLASFEEYSAQCLNDSVEDAQVHAHLRSVAGSARALFEGALAFVLAHAAQAATAPRAPSPSLAPRAPPPSLAPIAPLAPSGPPAPA